MNDPKGQEPSPELVAPYCGGCGHRFFSEPRITQDVALKLAVDRRCHYCVDEEEMSS